MADATVRHIVDFAIGGFVVKRKSFASNALPLFDIPLSPLESLPIPAMSIVSENR